MDDQIDIIDNGEKGTVIGMSWVAYLRLIPIAAVSAVVLAIAAYILGDNYARDKIFYAVVLGTVVWIFYELMYIQTQRLVINSMGVWYMAGILPWKKQSNGIQWRNVGIVSYNNNLTTYLTKAYTINISDRYTEKTVLSVKNLINGEQILMQINGILNEKALAER